MTFLIIQTAFIGDVILATALVEKIKRCYPGANIDFLLRQGNESLLKGHPYLRKVLIWKKKTSKYDSLRQLRAQIRQEKYDWVINCQRFAASGFLTAFSGAGETVGFDKNPFSFLFSRKLPHNIGDGTHEVARNLSLIRHLVKDDTFERPRLYPAPSDYDKTWAITQKTPLYVCLAPTSVWFTKQWPAHKWTELINRLPANCTAYLLGGPGDKEACQAIADATGRPGVFNLAGELSMLESAALMGNAAMNYVNDSAPLHMASAVNAPVTAIFCSTLPSFGFGPLSDKQSTVEVPPGSLECRPCGLHGRKSCPQNHFGCAENIEVSTVPLPFTTVP